MHSPIVIKIYLLALSVAEQNHQVGDMKRSVEWKNMLNSAETVGLPYQDQEKLKGRILIDIEIMTGKIFQSIERISSVLLVEVLCELLV